MKGIIYLYFQQENNFIVIITIEKFYFISDVSASNENVIGFKEHIGIYSVFTVKVFVSIVFIAHIDLAVKTNTDWVRELSYYLDALLSFVFHM